MWWWVYVTLVVMSAHVTLATVTSHMYRKQGHMYAGGDVLVSRKVRSNIECGWECVPPECVGYHIMDKTNASLQCTTFSFVNNFTQHPDALYYCSGCRNKGENCSKDEQCTEFTLNSTCSLVTSVCTCDEFFEDDGDLCQLKASQLGEQCGLKEQCLLVTHNSTCEATVCVCQENFNREGNICKFDHRKAGFTEYGGRLVYHRIPGLVFPISWNGAVQYCKDRDSTMFIPRNANEFTWIDDQIRSYLGVAAHFPINDKNLEGSLMWNDGTSVGGEQILGWDPLSLNLDLFDCVAMFSSKGVYPLLTPPYLAYQECSLFIVLYSVICEAPL